MKLAPMEYVFKVRTERGIWHHDLAPKQWEKSTIDLFPILVLLLLGYLKETVQKIFAKTNHWMTSKGFYFVYKTSYISSTRKGGISFPPQKPEELKKMFRIYLLGGVW